MAANVRMTVFCDVHRAASYKLTDVSEVLHGATSQRTAIFKVSLHEQA
jgi:hypothetical protein